MHVLQYDFVSMCIQQLKQAIYCNDRASDSVERNSWPRQPKYSDGCRQKRGKIKMANFPYTSFTELACSWSCVDDSSHRPCNLLLSFRVNISP